MKTIGLTQGRFALVDDDLFEQLNRHKWHAMKTERHWYAGRKVRVNGERVLILMHREVADAPDGMVVDHRNRYGLDNQRSNLRVCTQSQNLHNAKTRAANKTGAQGVYWNREKKKFHVQIRADGRRVHVGYFKDFEAAKAAASSAALLAKG